MSEDTDDLTEAHKEARGEGRTQQAAVQAYLDGLEALQPVRRGPKRTEEQIREAIARNARIIRDDRKNSTERLVATQKKLDLEAELEEMLAIPKIEHLREKFVEHALPYAKRHKITYRAWREMGVEPATLKAAGITRYNI